MPMQLSSRLLAAAAALALAIFSAPASAACTTDTQNAWECLEAGGTDLTSATTYSGPYTYEGSMSLSHWYTGTMNCTIIVVVEVIVDPVTNEGSIRITVITSGCLQMTFPGLPSTATISGASGGDIYTKHTGSTTGVTPLTIDYNGTTVCSDYVDLEFGNDVNHTDKDEPSYIKVDDTLSGWAGSCTLQIDATTDGYTDVNMW